MPFRTIEWRDDAVIMIDLQIFEQLGLALAVGLLILFSRTLAPRAASDAERVLDASQRLSASSRERVS